MKQDTNYCTMCEKEKSILKFWKSESIINSNGYLHICSDCIGELFNKLYVNFRCLGSDFDVNANTIIFDETTEAVFREVCRYIDLSFNYSAYEAMKNHIENNKDSKKILKVFGIYKSKLSSTIKNNNDRLGQTYNYSDDKTYDISQLNKDNHALKKIVNIEELKSKWGDYSPDTLIRFDKKRKFLLNNYKEKTNMHSEALDKYVRYSVLEEIAMEKDDDKKAEKWGNMAAKAATNAKINPNQLSAADLSEGLNTMAELTQAVERAVDVIPILPKFKFRPNDALDFVIWTYVNYERDLRGLPLCEYGDIYNFYEDRKQEYIKQYGDPYGIFEGDTTEKNREKIETFIKMPDEYNDNNGELDE